MVEGVVIQIAPSGPTSTSKMISGATQIGVSDATVS